MAITRKSAYKLQTTQGAIEKATLGISLRVRVQNDKICRRTGVMNMNGLVARMRWQWVGHIAIRQDQQRRTDRTLVWRPRETKQSVGTPRKRWRDDIRNIAENN